MAKFYPTDSGCVLALQFEGNLTDLSGNGNNGTLVGNATYDADGYDGNALILDGNGDYVTVADSNTLDFTAACTISAWIKQPAFVPTNTIISKRSAYDATGIPFEIATDNSNINVRIKGTDNQLNVAHNMSVDTWHNVCVIWNGTTLKVYVDKVEKGSANISGTITVNNTDVYIGSIPSVNEYFNGRIDRLFVFNEAKSVQNMEDEYDQVSADTATAGGFMPTYPTHPKFKTDMTF